jgi:hypothetical protein
MIMNEIQHRDKLSVSTHKHIHTYVHQHTVSWNMRSSRKIHDSATAERNSIGILCVGDFSNRDLNTKPRRQCCRRIWVPEAEDFWPTVYDIVAMYNICSRGSGILFIKIYGKKC